MSEVIKIAWFLWSVVHGNPVSSGDVVWQPVKEFKTQEQCLKALEIYQVEVDKAYPPCEPLPGENSCAPSVIARLECSPIYPGTR